MPVLSNEAGLQRRENAKDQVPIIVQAPIPERSEIEKPDHDGPFVSGIRCRGRQDVQAAASPLQADGQQRGGNDYG
jgi:hypothetical protein